jgi:hypothetical protein
MKSVAVKMFGAAFVLTAFGTLTVHAQTAPAVPEPSTYVAGALMLIPLGAGMLRAYYKNRRK